MRVHVHRRRPEQLADWLRDAGFAIDAQLLLDPDRPDNQAILFAHRPNT